MPDTLNRLKAALAHRYAIERELGACRSGGPDVFSLARVKGEKPQKARSSKSLEERKGES